MMAMEKGGGHALQSPVDAVGKPVQCLVSGNMRTQAIQVACYAPEQEDGCQARSQDQEAAADRIGFQPANHLPDQEWRQDAQAGKQQAEENGPANQSTAFSQECHDP